MLATFQAYGSGHLFILAVLALFTVSCILILRKYQNTKTESRTVALLAFLCIVTIPFNLYVWFNHADSFSLDNVVPLHLCDIASVICAFALITRKQLLCELSYFWGLAGTLQGLLTPALYYPFPHPICIAFFLHHGIVVATALILPLGLGWRPHKGAYLRVFSLILIYALFAGITNWILGTNYGFLSQKPEQASLLDIMPSWPYYIPILIGIAALFLFFLSLPFLLKKEKSQDG